MSGAWFDVYEEILDMEVTIYSYEDILYKNPMDMTDDEKKKEVEKDERMLKMV